MTVLLTCLSCFQVSDPVVACQNLCAFLSLKMSIAFVGVALVKGVLYRQFLCAVLAVSGHQLQVEARELNIHAIPFIEYPFSISTSFAVVHHFVSFSKICSPIHILMVFCRSQTRGRAPCELGIVRIRSLNQAGVRTFFYARFSMRVFLFIYFGFVLFSHKMNEVWGETCVSLSMQS